MRQFSVVLRHQRDSEPRILRSVFYLLPSPENYKKLYSYWEKTSEIFSAPLARAWFDSGFHFIRRCTEVNSECTLGDFDIFLVRLHPAVPDCSVPLLPEIRCFAQKWNCTCVSLVGCSAAASWCFHYPKCTVLHTSPVAADLILPIVLVRRVDRFKMSS